MDYCYLLHTVAFQTLKIVILSLLDSLIFPPLCQILYHSPTDSNKNSGPKVISPAVVSHAVTHCSCTHGRQSGQAIEQDPPRMLLGDSPAGQVVIQTGAQ